MARSSAKVYRSDRWKHPFTFIRLWLAVRIWALRLPIIARDRELERLLRRAAPRPGTPFRSLKVETIARCCHRAVRRPWLMADRPCLREGLLLHRFLTMAGHRPSLHFGIDRERLKTETIAAHCWVVLPPDHVFNPPQPAMTEIFVHPHDAVATASSVARP